LVAAKFVLAVMLLITRLTDPVFVIDRLRVPTEPTTTLPKVIEVADMVATCATAACTSRMPTSGRSKAILGRCRFISALSVAI
jgi:hypothetical protein